MEDMLKKNWQNIGNSVDINTVKMMRDILKKDSALENLAKRYKRFAITSTVMVFWCVLFLFIPQIDGEVGRTAVVLLFVFMELYFICAAACDYYLAHKIRQIDICSQSLSEVTAQCARCKKIHLRFVIIYIPLCIALIWDMCYVFGNVDGIAEGIIFGAILGAVIGLDQFMRFMKDYRELI